MALPFGKYRGVTLPEILLTDPTYVTEFLSEKWVSCLSNPDTSPSNLRLGYQLEVLANRAQNILVPLEKRRSHRFAVWKDDNGGFAGVTLYPIGKKPRPPKDGLVLAERTNKISLLLPLNYSKPKRGLKRLRNSLERLCLADMPGDTFGERLVSFFNDRMNFALEGLEYTSLFMTEADALAIQAQYAACRYE